MKARPTPTGTGAGAADGSGRPGAGTDAGTSTQPGIAESSAGITAPDLEGAQP
jgi:hypothetical protein